jgi:BirA family biotin operon repressor/biotin-[acetyl-CoA-carboxylase] ligase
MLEFNIYPVEETKSTNSHLKSMAATSKVDEGTVILADYQSGGRGQGDNIWQADRGLNILCSILLKPEIDALHFFSLTTMFSLALTDMLKDLFVEAQIKWPNDIYYENSKLAGLLIENSLTGPVINQSIAGIGLNVNQKEFPSWIPNPVSLSAILGREQDREALQRLLLTKIASRYAQMKAGRFDDLLQEYNSKLYRAGQRCRFRNENGEFTGMVKAVKTKGEFVLELPSGELKAYLFGEIKMLI